MINEADQAGPKESFYSIAPTSTPDVLRDTLSLAYGQVGRVRKRRTLFLSGRTRIHLDRVEGLTVPLITPGNVDIRVYKCCISLRHIPFRSHN